ncbi:MAG: peptidoglycan D,D-transpeptidase FtsI family protein [Alphaproteobacteria bacterium]
MSELFTYGQGEAPWRNVDAGPGEVMESRAVETGRRRIVIAAAVLVAAYAAIGVRLAGLAVAEPQAGDRIARSQVPEQRRAEIVDRNGRLLAADMTGYILAADTWRVVDPQETARRIAGVLDLDADGLARRLSNSTGTVWLKRELTPRQRYAVHNLGLAGIRFVEERRRVYPQGPVLSHVLGFADADGKGRAGIERSLNERLTAQAEDESMALSIDLRFQHALRDELVRTMERFKAGGAAGLVLDVRSGEILALASLPDFDPNRPADALKAGRLNRVTMGTYEFGSTLKAFTVAMALDAGAVALDTTYDVSEPVTWGRFRIRDYHRHDEPMTVAEIFRHSSNIGTAKITLDAGVKTQRDYLERFGLLKRPNLELPEVSAPLLPRRWNELEAMTISYGHGIALNMVQLAAGAAALVNGGCRVEPTLLRGGGENEGCARVITERTSKTMRALLRDVVENGTGRRAQVQGYPIGGKTGSAEKPSRGGYDRRALLSSFMGVFPAHNPRYLLIVAVDEPTPGADTSWHVTGGITAAPAVARVVSRIGPIVAYAPGEAETGPVIVASN